MGDNFLRQQVHNFKKGRDKALEKLTGPTLFTVPEMMGKSYPVFEVNGQTATPQERLLAVPSKTLGRVELVRGTCHVGFAEGDAAKQLLAATGDAGVYVQVESRNDLSGVIQVRIVKLGEAA